MHNSTVFDFPFRIICSIYQIHRQHPWISKKKIYIQNRVISANSYSHYSQMVIRDMCHIIVLVGKIYFPILALISVRTGRSYYVINQARAYDRFQFDVKNVNHEGKFSIYIFLTSGKTFFFKVYRKVFPYSVTGLT